MSEDGSTRARQLGYEIQHIFASEIGTQDSTKAEAARELLLNVDFDLESRSNKIALLRDPATRDAIANAPPEVRAALAAAGFGENTHDSRASGGNHPEYNAFQNDNNAWSKATFIDDYEEKYIYRRDIANRVNVTNKENNNHLMSWIAA